MNDYNNDVSQLRKLCSTSGITRSNDIFSYTNGSLNVTNDDVEFKILENDYFDKVEEGNTYISELLSTEKKYFEKKYGEDLYNYLKDKRTNYIKSKTSNSNSNTIQIDTTSGAPPEEYANQLRLDLSNNYDTYLLLNSVNTENALNNYKDSTRIVEDGLSEMYNTNSLESRKVEYREDVYTNIVYYNNLLSILYYILFFIIVIVLYSQDKLDINNKWFLYIIVLIFPVLIFPYLFIILRYISKKISDLLNYHGPKNAFINTNFKLNFLDNHNI